MSVDFLSNFQKHVFLSPSAWWNTKNEMFAFNCIELSIFFIHRFCFRYFTARDHPLCGDFGRRRLYGRVCRVCVTHKTKHILRIFRCNRRKSSLYLRRDSAQQYDTAHRTPKHTPSLHVKNKNIRNVRPFRGTLTIAHIIHRKHYIWFLCIWISTFDDNIPSFRTRIYDRRI